MIYYSGQTATLTSSWYAYFGGPAADITDVTVTIKKANGTVVLATTSVGVTHTATGVYAYAWAVPADLAPGDYVVLWAGTDTEDDDVQASETITVVLRFAANSWATPEQVLAVTGVSVTDAQLTQAQSVIDIFSNITFDDADTISLRDTRLISLATCYQAVWQANQIDVTTRTDVSALTQDGIQVTPRGADSLLLAPLAKRCLDRLSWRKARSVRVRPGRCIQYPNIEAVQEAWLSDAAGLDNWSQGWS